MATIPVDAPAPDEIDDLRDYRSPLSVEQYHAMLENGILDEGEPLELLDGQIVHKDRRDESGDVMTVGPRHGFIVTFLAEFLRSTVAKLPVHVRVQQPITLAEFNEPEPDISVARGKPIQYAEQHPQSGDLELVIEVAYSSRIVDQRRKKRIYASAGIPQYWIVNLHDNVVEVFTQPDKAAGEFRQQEICSTADQLPFQIAKTDFTVTVAEFLNPAK